MATSYYDQIKKDSGLKITDTNTLLSKFNKATRAEYDKQRTDLQTATNKYYDQLYDTQQTTMDTIRQANAQAVASGASKGVQAANELSALLGLQSEAVTGATDLANQATTLAQDESQAILENMLTAETQAAEQNQALAQVLNQAGSVDVEQNRVDAEQQNAETALLQVIETIRQTNPELAQRLLKDYYENQKLKAESNTSNASVNTSNNANASTNTDTATNTGTSTETNTEDKAAIIANINTLPSVKYNPKLTFSLGKEGEQAEKAVKAELDYYFTQLGLLELNVDDEIKKFRKAVDAEGIFADEEAIWNAQMEQYRRQALARNQ